MLPFCSHSLSWLIEWLKKCLDVVMVWPNRLIFPDLVVLDLVAASSIAEITGTLSQ